MTEWVKPERPPAARRPYRRVVDRPELEMLTCLNCHATEREPRRMFLRRPGWVPIDLVARHTAESRDVKLSGRWVCWVCSAGWGWWKGKTYLGPGPGEKF